MELRSQAIPPRFRELATRVADFICSHQLPSGAIPWYRDGVTIPWDHVESAIGLDLCGRLDEAARAYMWLRRIQNPDGSWWYSYLDDQPQELAKDANHSSYVATGVWHHYLATGDVGFLRQMWPMVEKGVDFALGLQQPTGEVYWARDADGAAWPSALLTASSCIWQSMVHGMKIARMLGSDRPEWHEASERLARAIRERPQRFDTLGDNKRGYSMNWYYPVLAGVIRGERARKRILQGWDEFVVEGWGCKCSLDQPWVTVAETCELILSLAGIGESQRAQRLLEWTLQMQDADGGFWTGVRVPEGLIWPPDEKTTWTSASVVMALVALSQSEGVGSDSM